MSALYIHIPFCKKMCAYCDFFKSVSLSSLPATIESIEREMEWRSNYLNNKSLKTIYFGGGTPSLLHPEQIERLIDKAYTLWDCSAVEEITIETNPDDLTPEYLSALRTTRVNRLSIGIQSFIDRDLEFMNRRHTGAQAVEAVKRCQDAGYNNISIDLIYGIPGMSAQEWLYNIGIALYLGIQHISAYHLTIEPRTAFGVRNIKPVNEEISEQEYDTLCNALHEGGFQHYEISNFCLPGRESKHNSTYWSGEEYLGIGPSAHSFNGSARSWVVSSIKGYTQGVGSDTIYEGEELTEQDRYNEYIMVSLRTARGVSRKVLEQRFGARKLQEFELKAEQFSASGSMLRQGEWWIIPESKWLTSDDIISTLFEC